MLPKKKKTSGVIYSAEDHATWARFFARQKKLVSKYGSKEFLRDLERLALDPAHVPDIQRVTARIYGMTGWKLLSVGHKSVSIDDWFTALRKRIFPVTNYIRQPEHFEYTAKPDMFHEYFGHVPFLTDKKFAAVTQKFGALCKNANKRQALQISRIWSLGVEFSLIKEKNTIKIFGAGLLSSHGECLHAIDLIKKGRVVPFDLKKVIATPGRTYEYHKKYFVLNSMDDISDALDAYAKKESLVIR